MLCLALPNPAVALRGQAAPEGSAFKELAAGLEEGTAEADETFLKAILAPFETPPVPPEGLLARPAPYPPRLIPMSPERVQTVRAQASDLIRRSTEDGAVRSAAERLVERFLARLEGEAVPGHPMREMTDNEGIEMVLEIVRAATGTVDPMAELKQAFNEEALRFLPEMGGLVGAAADPWSAAIGLGVLGNAIDFADHAQRRRLEEKGFDMAAAIRQSAALPYRLDDRDWFFQALKETPEGEVLFLVDNAGEIVFDLPLIRLFLDQGRRVSLVGKSSPHFNDMTAPELSRLLEDPRVRDFLGPGRLERQIRVIAGGTAMTGLDLRRAAPDLVKAWRQAAVIYAKGQGMIETLRYAPVSRPLFHAVMVKAPGYFREKDPEGRPMALAYGDALFLRTAGAEERVLGEEELVRLAGARWVAFGVHPDDVELAAAGFLGELVRRGAAVSVGILTTGAGRTQEGLPIGVRDEEAATVADKVRLRQMEAREGARRMGLDPAVVHFFGFGGGDSRVDDLEKTFGPAAQGEVVEYLRRQVHGDSRPLSVCLHDNAADPHPAHAHGQGLLLKAVQQFADESGRRVEVWLGTLAADDPRTTDFLPMAPEAHARKRSALGAHQTQILRQEAKKDKGPHAKTMVEFAEGLSQVSPSERWRLPGLPKQVERFQRMLFAAAEAAAGLSKDSIGRDLRTALAEVESELLKRTLFDSAGKSSHKGIAALKRHQDRLRSHLEDILPTIPSGNKERDQEMFDRMERDAAQASALVRELEQLPLPAPRRRPRPGAGAEEGAQVVPREELYRRAPELAGTVLEAVKEVLLLPAGGVPTKPEGQEVLLYAHSTVALAGSLLLPDQWTGKIERIPLDDAEGANALLEQAREDFKAGKPVFIALDVRFTQGLKTQDLPLTFLLDPRRWGRLMDDLITGKIRAEMDSLYLLPRSALFNKILDLTAGSVRREKIQGRDWVLIYV